MPVLLKRLVIKVSYSKYKLCLPNKIIKALNPSKQRQTTFLSSVYSRVLEKAAYNELQTTSSKSFVKLPLSTLKYLEGSSSINLSFFWIINFNQNK